MERYMDFDVLYEALSQYGPAVVILGVFLGLLISFVLRDWKRETRHQEVTEQILTKCEQSIATNTEVVRQNNQILTSFLSNAPRQS